MIDAPVGKGEHLGDDVRAVTGTGKHRVRRPTPRRGSNFSSSVDRNHDSSAGEPRSRDHLQADAAAPDHAHAGADAQPGAIDRANPGHYAAAGSGPATAGSSRAVAPRRWPARPRTARDATIRPCCNTPPSAPRNRDEPSISIPATPLRAAVSHSVPAPRPAGAAPTARGHEAERHVVAHDNVDDVLADRLYDARALLTEHHRPAAAAERPICQVHVGMTHARSRNPHQHLTAAGRGQHHRLVPTGRPGSRRTAARISITRMPSTSTSGPREVSVVCAGNRDLLGLEAPEAP